MAEPEHKPQVEERNTRHMHIGRNALHKLLSLSLPLCGGLMLNTLAFSTHPPRLAPGKVFHSHLLHEEPGAHYSRPTQSPSSISSLHIPVKPRSLGIRSEYSWSRALMAPLRWLRLERLFKAHLMKLKSSTYENRLDVGLGFDS